MIEIELSRNTHSTFLYTFEDATREDLELALIPVNNQVENDRDRFDGGLESNSSNWSLRMERHQKGIFKKPIKLHHIETFGATRKRNNFRFVNNRQTKAHLSRLCPIDDWSSDGITEINQKFSKYLECFNKNNKDSAHPGE